MKCVCDSQRMRRARRGTVKQPRTEAGLQNDHGEIDYSVETNWAVYLSGVYFAIKTTRSAEPVVSEQMTGALTHVLTTRYSPAKERITPSMKIVITRNGIEHTYLVAGPPRNIDDRWLEIPCVEEVQG
jgi:hypothetical protein